MSISYLDKASAIKLINKINDAFDPRITDLDEEIGKIWQSIGTHIGEFFLAGSDDLATLNKHGGHLINATDELYNKTTALEEHMNTALTDEEIDGVFEEVFSDE